MTMSTSQVRGETKPPRDIVNQIESTNGTMNNFIKNASSQTNLAGAGAAEEPKSFVLALQTDVDASSWQSFVSR